MVRVCNACACLCFCMDVRGWCVCTERSEFADISIEGGGDDVGELSRDAGAWRHHTAEYIRVQPSTSEEARGAGELEGEGEGEGEGEMHSHHSPPLTFSLLARDLGRRRTVSFGPFAP